MQPWRTRQARDSAIRLVRLAMLAVLAGVGLLLPLAVILARQWASPPREAPYALLPADAPRKGRKVLVTGGAGFLGSYIVDAVQSRDGDCQVVVFDLRIPPPEARKPGVSYVQGASGRRRPWLPTRTGTNTRRRKGDVCNVDHLTQAMEGVESVFHAAGVTPSVVISDAKWVDSRSPLHVGARVASAYCLRNRIFRVNVGGTRAVVSAAREAGVARLVFTSSATVTLGRDDWETWAADESRPYPTVHIGAYGGSKQLAEVRHLAARALPQGQAPRPPSLLPAPPPPMFRGGEGGGRRGCRSVGARIPPASLNSPTPCRPPCLGLPRPASCAQRSWGGAAGGGVPARCDLWPRRPPGRGPTPFTPCHAVPRGREGLHGLGGRVVGGARSRVGGRSAVGVPGQSTPPLPGGGGPRPGPDA